MWDKGTKTPTAVEKSKTLPQAVVRQGAGKMGVVESLQGILGQLTRKEQSMEEVFLLVFALAMVGAAIDWAGRIIGWW